MQSLCDFMTDYHIYKKNPITKIVIRMDVRHAEKFDPETQQAFRELAKVAEYPKQTKITDWDVENQGRLGNL